MFAYDQALFNSFNISAGRIWKVMKSEIARAQRVNTAGSAKMRQALFACFILLFPLAGSGAEKTAAGGGKAGGQVARKPDLEAVRKNLKDPDHKKRREAMDELSGAPNSEKIPLLKDSLSDEDPLIKEKAARLIGRSKDVSAFKTLSDALAAADKTAKLGLLDGLGDLGDKNAVVPVAAQLSQEDRNTRWKAAEVLGRLKADEGVDALLKAAVEDKDEFVKKASVESLGKIGTPKAAAALAAIKAGKDEKLSRWADNVLKSVGK